VCCKQFRWEKISDHQGAVLSGPSVPANRPYCCFGYLFLPLRCEIVAGHWSYIEPYYAKLNLIRWPVDVFGCYFCCFLVGARKAPDFSQIPVPRGQHVWRLLAAYLTRAPHRV
jgi:hypothetical protein